MFEIRENTKGERILFYVDRPRRSSERGMWIEVCRETDKQCDFFVSINRELGVQVEIDQYGTYRALVLGD
jgi:hypothetical protein